MFGTISTIRDKKSAAKFHDIKTVSGKVVMQSIAFWVVSIYWQGVRSPLEARALHTLYLIAQQPWLASDFHSGINSWIDCQTSVYTIWLSIQQFNQLLSVQSTVGPTVRPTVRSILKPCKCAIMLLGKLPVITGKTAWNWRCAVLSADAGLLVYLCSACGFRVVKNVTLY